MNNYLYIYETDMPTVSMIRKDATILYGKNVRFLSLREIRPKDLEWADNVFFIRPNNIFSYLLSKKAHKIGCFVTVFCDDDLLNLPSSLPSMPWRKNQLKKILGEADLFQSSNAYLCEKYAVYTRTKRCYASDTLIFNEDIEQIPKKKSSDDNIIKLVYAAGRDHASIFFFFIAPILPKLEERYGSHISLTTVGVNPDLSSFANGEMKIEHVEGMPLEKYRNYMREQCFDIGLAPLRDSDFNKCKYFNKFLEYTLVGTAGIYSNCEPYTLVVRNRENGFLADNTEESWFRTICDAIDDHELRKTCVNNAIELMKMKFSPEMQLKALFEAVPELTKKKDSSKTCGTLLFARILYGAYRLGDLCYLSVYYLKRQGIGGFLRKIKEHIKLVKALK